jgi:hypothetical protein
MIFCIPIMKGFYLNFKFYRRKFRITVNNKIFEILRPLLKLEFYCFQFNQNLIITVVLIKIIKISLKKL